MGKEETTHWLQAHCNYSANDEASVMEHKSQNNDDNQSNTK